MLCVLLVQRLCHWLVRQTFLVCLVRSVDGEVNMASHS
jgi:hypothetical protein